MKTISKTLLSALLFSLAIAAHAQSVPSLINYQGQVLNPDGSAPPTADYELTFNIYDAPSGGTLIWGPQRFNGQSGPGLGGKVPVVQGYFNVILGPVDTASRSLASAFLASPRFIEITISNRPPIQPRQQLLSAPFALRAGDADRSELATNSLLLGGVPSANILPGIVPIGTVLPFFGDTNALGANWHVCDGTVVTDAQSPFNARALPDLRGQFLFGAQTAATVGTKGGTNSIYSGVTMSSAGAHSHVVNSHNHSLPANTGSISTAAPSRSSYSAICDGSGTVSTARLLADCGFTDGEGQHVHSLGGNTGSATPGTSTAADHTHTVNPFPALLPPYTTTLFIIRIK